jgi:hypothetical protein
MRLTDNEIRDINRLLESGKPLPDQYRFLLFDDKREVELVWNGKTNEICNIVLPFQVIEQVDEPRAEKPSDTKLQAGLFDERGRQLKGWTNKLIWGDNKLILSSLKNGPLREEIEKQGGIKLIYIDPPFDVGADFSMDIEIGGDTFTKKPNILEEIAYRDTWGKGADSFIAMIYERLILMRDLLADDGSIYVHCDWRLNSFIRLALDEVFGNDSFRNDIIWQRTSSHNDPKRFGNVHDTLLYYVKADGAIWNQQFDKPDADFFDAHDFETDADGRHFRKRDLTAPAHGRSSGQYPWKGKPKAPLIVEVDQENEKKNLEALDIEIPVLTPRVFREYKNLRDLDITKMPHQTVAYLEFTEEQQREIVFKDVTTGEVTHTTILDTAGIADYRSAIGYFAQTIMKDLRLVSGYDVLYPKVKAFIETELFGQTVDLESPNTLRNLSEISATKTIIETFKKAINDLTVQDKGDAEIRDTIKLRQTRPFIAKEQGYLIPRKSVFNRIIGDSPLELEFARFLDDCDDIISFAKIYMAIGFKIDYVNSKGEITNYFPDFVVKKDAKHVFIVETKGLEDLDVPLKTERLKQWCQDVNARQSDVIYDFVFVDQESFDRYRPKSFSELVTNFRQYKG